MAGGVFIPLIPVGFSVTLLLSLLLCGDGRSWNSWNSVHHARKRTWGYGRSSTANKHLLKTLLNNISWRGGVDISGEVAGDEASQYTSVGIVPLGEQTAGDSIGQSEVTWLTRLLPTAASKSSLVLTSKPQRSGETERLSRATLPRDDFSIEAFCSICDVVVIWFENPGTANHRAWVTRLLEGVRRRQQAGLEKLHVIVFFRSIQDENKGDGKQFTLESTASQIVLDEDLQGITPEHVGALDVVNLEDTDQVETVWRDLVESTSVAASGRHKLVERDGFGLLMERVYQALSSQPCKVSFESTAARKKAFLDEEEETFVDGEALGRQVFQQADAQLERLERKQQEVWLNPGDHVPLLEFGQEANAILLHASDALEKKTPPSQQVRELRRDLLSHIVSGKLRFLYEQQLQSLREHYGRRYEVSLDASNDQQEWTNAAQKATQSFRDAAQEAVPELCREGRELRDDDVFSYVASLQGLVSDMMEATSQREDYLKAAVGSDDEEEEGSAAAKQPPKWYQKLAARAAVLAVNYLQGWLAWQAIRRAAAERDRDMPKFPLF